MATQTTTTIKRSLLDVDIYKLTMSQYAFHYHRNVEVEYKFINRRPTQRLADVIDIHDLIFELNQWRNVMLTPLELQYLKDLNLFTDQYLNFLSELGGHTINLPQVKVEKNDDGQFFISTVGPWPIAMLWETIILSVINEMYFAKQNVVLDYAATMLFNKIKILQENPQIKFIEFGTRRRLSQEWQEYVVINLASMLPKDQFLGTSNAYLAQQFDVPVVGTFAHELPMVNAGIIGVEALLEESQNFAFDKWFLMYGERLSICLPDTFTSEHTFRTFGQIRGRNWKGFRQDSGDPFVFGRRLLDVYKGWGVDPKTKTLIFSDDLNITKMYELQKEFGDKINVVFGWGTNLTNDTNLQPLSIVMKAVEANGAPLVKLSDDPIKHTGEDMAIKTYKRIFYE